MISLHVFESASIVTARSGVDVRKTPWTVQQFKLVDVLLRQNAININVFQHWSWSAKLAVESMAANKRRRGGNTSDWTQVPDRSPQIETSTAQRRG